MEPETLIYVYDIEVLRGPDEVEGGWQNPEAMGFGTAVVYSYKDNLYHFFGPDQKREIIGLLADSHVVSFNGIKFDNAVLMGNDYQKAGEPWTNRDILLDVVKGKYSLGSVLEAEKKLGDKEIHDGSIGLDGLAEGTLGMHKTGHGAKAPQLIKEGKWAEVFAYNLHDVRLTKMLYDFAKKYGYLIDRNGLKINL